MKCLLQVIVRELSLYSRRWAIFVVINESLKCFVYTEEISLFTFVSGYRLSVFVAVCFIKLARWFIDKSFDIIIKNCYPVQWKMSLNHSTPAVSRLNREDHKWKWAAWALVQADGKLCFYWFGLASKMFQFNYGSWFKNEFKSLRSDILLHIVKEKEIETFNIFTDSNKCGFRLQPR